MADKKERGWMIIWTVRRVQQPPISPFSPDEENKSAELLPCNLPAVNTTTSRTPVPKMVKKGTKKKRKRHTKTVDDQSVNRAQVKFSPHVLITIFWGPRVLKKNETKKGQKWTVMQRTFKSYAFKFFLNVHQQLPHSRTNWEILFSQQTAGKRRRAKDS